MIKTFFTVAAFLLISFVFAQQPQVKVEEGIMEGITLSSGVQAFRGIPFAKPPVGNLRWKEPQPADHWTGIRKVDRFGNSPMQKPIYGDMRFRSPGISEDCLYLNVWRPKAGGSDKLPVLVYFYGGGFNAGDGSENRYDGESFAKEGIIVVTVNYRLGIFGFFAHPELTQESPKNASGNYGLLDQYAALAWVKKNIAAFGGDPDEVTIGGESAGSMSVSAQMSSPLSKGLFKRAIGQSGSVFNLRYGTISLGEQEQKGVAFATKVNAGNLDQLRKIPAAELLDRASEPGAFMTRLIIDGYFLPKSPLEIFEAGEQSKVSLLAGWTSTEAPYTAFTGKSYPSPDNYERLVREQFGARADEVLKLYPGKTESEVITSATALASDNFIVYSTWKWLDLQRINSGQPVYVYTFSKARPPMKAAYNNVETGLAGGIRKKSTTADKENLPPVLPGAFHASDIEYLLGNLKSNDVFDWTKDDYKASLLGQRYFINFIKTGNPNGKNLAVWPKTTATDKVMNILDLNIEAQASPEKFRDRYLFLDGLFIGKK
ncbi:carboxylesterase/lipase family protein [Sphingobacterium athyrii]|uniref:Carboxylic ester hydrolase n=1 Tax=Sphingobacterium athyrii TaxID=2152717 RepID=A0A363NVZ4_9SPHI|nr:carboxylesterase family protein [Sphingobacterium athyrii]PUV24982.1 carboxylesterase [Sphingobacterium athyrii]